MVAVRFFCGGLGFAVVVSGWASRFQLMVVASGGYPFDGFF